MDDRYIDAQTGALSLEDAGLIAYAHGHYYTLGRELGHFGFLYGSPRKGAAGAESCHADIFRQHNHYIKIYGKRQIYF